MRKCDSAKCEKCDAFASRFRRAVAFAFAFCEAVEFASHSHLRTNANLHPCSVYEPCRVKKKIPSRLVHTSLTDKCFLTLTQALSLGLDGNPYGSASTGKTESVKELGFPPNHDNDAVFTQDDILAIFDPISSSESSSSAVSTPQLSSASSSQQSRKSASKPPRTLPPVSLILRPPRPEDIHLPTPPYVAPIVFPNSNSILTTNAVTVPPLPSRTQSTFVNQNPNAVPEPPRRRQSLAANAVRLRNSSQTIARRNRISSDRASSVYSR
ncbi:unnamed protein product [Oikopleura dioica]|uniref:Dynein heavy chain hydrolytic ATP-binding dynein motor region domain-containing protein n=1 Tax=Oikopleura dioica TaxID=34765 RepID=E4WW16_OIKDI|nr:unnamed protein product [Oikopleura dioica]